MSKRKLSLPSLLVAIVAASVYAATAVGDQPINEQAPKKDLPQKPAVSAFCAEISAAYSQVLLTNSCGGWVRANIVSPFANAWFWLEPGHPRFTYTFTTAFMPYVAGEAGGPPSGGLEAASKIAIKYFVWGSQADVFCSNSGSYPALLKIQWFHSGQPYGESTLICPMGMRDRIFTFAVSDAKQWAYRFLIASWEPL